MKRPHIILRKITPTRGPVRGPRPVENASGSTFVVEVEELDEKKNSEYKKRPELEQIAPTIPVHLITPIEFTAGAGGTQPSAIQPDGQTTWGIEAVEAHTSPFTGQGVVVAVLDTGIDQGHPAFSGMEIVARDFTGNGAVRDRNGHGTHCAGTIFGKSVNGYRIGVAPGVSKAIIGKVLNDGGKGETLNLAFGIHWAIEQGANILSISIGIDFPGLVSYLVEEKNLPEDIAASQALVDFRDTIKLFDSLSNSIQAFSNHGRHILPVAATGNESRRDVNMDFVVSAGPPAAANGFISVGALLQTNEGLDVAPFSNSRPVVSAPGVKIISARAGGGLVALSGTSMATPHVAGVAALWEEKRRATPMRGMRPLRDQLINSATWDKIHPDATSDEIGAGIVTAPQR